MTAPPTVATPAPVEKHCIVHVIDRAASGRLRTTEPVCSASRAEAGARAASSEMIGVHFEGAGYTGSSFTVVGDDCTGGWLDLNAAWINRVSSTLHGCPRIRHFNGYGLTGTNQTTMAPGANLGALNNLTNSIQYLP